jgi:hypothetical protein
MIDKSMYSKSILFFRKVAYILAVFYFLFTIDSAL